MSFIALMATLLDSHTSTSSSLLTGPSHPHSSAFFHPSGALSRLLGWAQHSVSATYGCQRLHKEHFVSIFFLPVASPPTVTRVRPLRPLRLFQLALSFKFSSSNAFTFVHGAWIVHQFGSWTICRLQRGLVPPAASPWRRLLG